MSLVKSCPLKLQLAGKKGEAVGGNLEYYEELIVVWRVVMSWGDK